MNVEVGRCCVAAAALGPERRASKVRTSVLQHPAAAGQLRGKESVAGGVDLRKRREVRVVVEAAGFVVKAKLDALEGSHGAVAVVGIRRTGDLRKGRQQGVWTSTCG